MAKSLTTTPNFQKYPQLPDEERTAPFRIAAHYLDWAAENYPNQYTPWNVILRVVTGRSTTPREDSQDVKQMRKCGTRIRKCLMENYHRELENITGIGVRATTGSLDVIRTRVTKRQRQWEQASAGLQATAALVNVAEIPSNAETRPIKEWFNTVVQPQLRKLEAVQKALALPAALQPDGEEKKE